MVGDYGDRMPPSQSRPMVNQLGDMLRRIKTGGSANIGAQGQPLSPFEPRVPLTEAADTPAARVVYDVRDFGAVGDGVADDAEALQTAITEAAASGGGLVWLAAGQYRCKSTVNLAPGVSLGGENYLASWIVVDGAHVGLNYSPGVLTELGIVIENLRIIGGPIGGTVTATTLVNLQNCRSVVIRNCNIRDTTVHAVALNFCFNVRVESCPMESFAQDGIHVVASNSGVVDNSEFHANTGPNAAWDNAISLDSCSCWTIVNATMEANGLGVNGLKLKDCGTVVLVGSFIEQLVGPAVDATTGVVNGFTALGNNVHTVNSVAWDFSGANAHRGVTIENNRAQVPNGGTIFAPGAATAFSFRFNLDAAISGALAGFVAGFTASLTDVVLETNQRQAGSFDVATAYKVAGTQVVAARRTGWTAATGTASRGTFATGTVTLNGAGGLAEHVKALIDDLIAHGVIGA